MEIRKGNATPNPIWICDFTSHLYKKPNHSHSGPNCYIFFFIYECDLDHIYMKNHDLIVKIYLNSQSRLLCPFTTIQVKVVWCDLDNRYET